MILKVLSFSLPLHRQLKILYSTIVSRMLNENLDDGASTGMHYDSRRGTKADDGSREDKGAVWTRELRQEFSGKDKEVATVSDLSSLFSGQFVNVI